MRTTLLLVTCLVACGAALGQSGEQFVISEYTFDQGGLPTSGIEAGSASFLHSPSSIGAAVGTARIASASFSIDGGFAAGLLPPGEVRDLLFDSTVDLRWRASPAAGLYRLYRASLDTLSGGGYGDCLASDLGSSSTTDDDPVAPADGFFYLVTVVDRLGREGSKGQSIQSGMSNERGGNVCP